MKRKGIRAFLLSLAAVLLIVPQIGAAEDEKKSVEEMIDARAMEFVAAWNEHDSEAMAMLWAEDGDFVNPFGRVARGREEVEKLFAEDHAGIMKGTTYSMTLKWVNMVTPDVAVATWDGKVSGMRAPDGTALPALDHLVTVVTKKKDGVWWTVAARAMAPVPMGPMPTAGESKK
jgi:uncharacterized protein (TIGR02246 family)